MKVVVLPIFLKPMKSEMMLNNSTIVFSLQCVSRICLNPSSFSANENGLLIEIPFYVTKSIEDRTIENITLRWFQYHYMSHLLSVIDLDCLTTRSIYDLSIATNRSLAPTTVCSVVSKDLTR